jgi:N-acetylneuraminate synthase
MSEIIVEIGNTHEGSLGIAKSFVRMAAESGVTTVKFQMHIPEHEGIPNEPFRVKFSDQDENRQSYWRRVNFSLENWGLLKQYCDQVGVEFLCTPFSVEAAEVLFENKLVKRWKIGSGNATDWPLIDYVSKTGMPLLISTGLASEAELTKVKERLVALGSWENTTLLHCVSKYPASMDQLDLHLMDELAKLGCERRNQWHRVDTGLDCVTKQPKCFGPISIDGHVRHCK